MYRQNYGESDSYIFDAREVIYEDQRQIHGRDKVTGKSTIGNYAQDAAKKGASGKDEDKDAECLGDSYDDPLNPERYFEHEKRWIEVLFDASRPADLSHLFRTSGTRVDPNEFFPMVVNECVAWPEFLEMARRILLQEADGVNGKGTSELDKSIPSTVLKYPSPTFTRPGNTGVSTTMNSDQRIRQQCSRSVDTLDGDILAAGTPTQLVVGQMFRGKCAPNAWRVFKFELPIIGPVITVMLDVEEGDLRLLVRRERTPGGAPGSGWDSGKSYQGLRIVKIFPHDRK